MNNTLNYYLTNGKLPGKVCCIYSFGRSGSYLFQSLFENFNHPEVLTVGFSSLIYFKESVKKVYLKDLNTKRNLNSALQILDYFPHLFSKPILGPSHKTVNKKKFVKIEYFRGVQRYLMEKLEGIYSSRIFVMGSINFLLSLLVIKRMFLHSLKSLLATFSKFSRSSKAF